MAGGHDHTHGVSGSTLRTAFLLTTLVLAVEVTGGLLSHSLALLSDAGHVLTDMVALALAWFAAVQSGWPANSNKTYGYHRTGILAALANAVTLLLIVGVIAFEAVQRFQHPQAVTPWLMFVSAAVGVAVNLYIGFGLHRESGHNLNTRAAALHAFGDVAASGGVIVGGVIIVLTRWYEADPLISLFIALLIARGAWGILHETVDILMEATPKDLNMAQMVRDIVRQPGVEDVHDLHVWSIAGGMSALSAHVRIADQPLSACDNLLAGLNRLLHEEYNIGHSTIQLECAGCSHTHLYCTMHPEGGADHSHAHSHDRQSGDAVLVGASHASDEDTAKRR